MDLITLGLLLVIFSGFLQGSFALFFRFTKPLAWENYWSIYSLSALVIVPLIATLIIVPNSIQILGSIPQNYLLPPLIFGALWGIGAILFGLSVERIGISLTFSIILGLTTVIGTILPLFINNSQISSSQLLLLLLGLLIISLGVAISGYSGILRDRKESTSNRKKIALGLVIAGISGIFSPLLNVAFISGKNIIIQAQLLGVSATNSTFIVWVVALFGGFLMNITYCLYLLNKNNSWKNYKKIQLKNIGASFTAGIFWYTGFGIFGVASIWMGNLGPSVGWAILISLSIIISNLWGIKLGEWKGVKKPLAYQFTSLIIISLGVAFIALSALTNQ